jgi:quinol monooxygenase YgiN
MIAVIVSYQVKPEFTEQNKKNIEQFLNDFRQLDATTFSYTVYTKDDNVTFVHYSTYKNEKVQTEILNVPSFKEFQRLRDESGLNGTHKVEILNFIGSSKKIFE